LHLFQSKSGVKYGINSSWDGCESLPYGRFKRLLYYKASVIDFFKKTSEKGEDQKNAQISVHRAHFTVQAVRTVITNYRFST